MQKVFSASKIFTGNEWLTDSAFIVKNDVIERILPSHELSQDTEITYFHDQTIIPAFIDAQVYGTAGKLLAVYPSAETLRIMNDEFMKQGTVLFLPTVATNTIEVFKKCIDAVKDYWGHGGQGVHGLHLEGPWLNADKRGAHVKEWIHVPQRAEVEDILKYGKGVIKMITLAPEECSDEIVELIRSHDIVIAAGHSNATYKQATGSFEKGITTVTHLYNAMSPLHHREPGLVGATLNNDHITASIIPDGHHVDYAAIVIAKKIMKQRLFAITDAVTETTTGPYQHYLAGDKYECNGILSGSALSMYQAFLNLVNHVGIEVSEALRMCSLYPAQVLGCAKLYGKIAQGYTGQFLVLNKQLEVVKIITSQKAEW
jgi:N-acetylglucosamine-6-phosphate deacetylase